MRSHWLPDGLLEVSVTLPPAQKVVGPPGVIVGVVTTTMETFVEFETGQPAAVVIERPRLTLPDAPAVYVTICALEPPVIVPLLIVHA